MLRYFILTNDDEPVLADSKFTCRYLCPKDLNVIKIIDKHIIYDKGTDAITRFFRSKNSAIGESHSKLY